jgi:hypothetical protein
MMKSLSDKRNMQKEIQIIRNHEDVVSDDDKEDGEIINNNKSSAKQGVGELMNNIFNGFKHF